MGDSLEEAFDKISAILGKSLLWFSYRQNNSGGYYVRDENVDEWVFVQALNRKEADARAEMFLDNSDSCPCCGDRWYFGWDDDEPGDLEPMIYGEPVSRPMESGREYAYVLHFADGRREIHGREPVK